MVVDASGSMARLWQPTMGGFNEYVDTLKRTLKAARSYFSAITFETAGVRKLQVGAPIAEAIRLSPSNYTPTGGTPLIDAVAAAIQATDEVVAKEGGTKTIVVVQTDGEENSSTKFTLAQLKALVEDRTAKGWEFVFIGAGINAFAQGSQMGFSVGNTMSYVADARSTLATFSASAQNSAAYGSGLVSSTAFSAAQRGAAGETEVLSNTLGVSKSVARRMAAGKAKP